MLNLKLVLDSGDPTIRYIWKSVDTSIKGKKIDIDTKVVSNYPAVKSPIIIAVKPLINSVILVVLSHLRSLLRILIIIIFFISDCY